MSLTRQCIFSATGSKQTVIRRGSDSALQQQRWRLASGYGFGNNMLANKCHLALATAGSVAYLLICRPPGQIDFKALVEQTEHGAQGFADRTGDELLLWILSRQAEPSRWPVGYTRLGHWCRDKLTRLPITISSKVTDMTGRHITTKRENQLRHLLFSCWLADTLARCIISTRLDSTECHAAAEPTRREWDA